MVGLFEIERANNLLHVRTKIIYLNIETEPLPWAMNRDTNRTVGPLYRCIPNMYTHTCIGVDFKLYELCLILSWFLCAVAFLTDRQMCTYILSYIMG